MYASEEKSAWSKVPEIATWVLLFIVLVPGTALGYFAENSLPNSPLYPIKRDLESVVLALSSFNNSAKSAYELYLADTRMKETQQILSSKDVKPQDLSQLDIIAAQLNAAEQSIATVNDASQKIQMQQQLSASVSTYKKRLASIQQQIHTTSATPNSIQNTDSSSGQNSAPTTDTASTDQNIPVNSQVDLSNFTDQQKTALDQQIQNINTQLDQITQTIEPTPTLELPTPTPTPSPYYYKHRQTQYNGEQNYSTSNDH